MLKWLFILGRIFFTVTKYLSNQPENRVYPGSWFQRSHSFMFWEWQSGEVYVTAARKQREWPAPSRYSVFCKVWTSSWNSSKQGMSRFALVTFCICIVRPYLLKLFQYYDHPDHGKTLLLTGFRTFSNSPGISSGSRHESRYFSRTEVSGGKGG